MAYETYGQINGVIREIQRGDSCCSQILRLDTENGEVRFTVMADTHKDRNRQMQIMIYDQRKSGGSSGHQLVGKNKHDDSQCHGGVAKENHEKIFWPKNIGFHGFDTLL